MDAFFASIEQRDDPALRGRPVLVGHDGPRGVVAAASYEARAFGCRSAMPVAIAKRHCPEAIIVSGSRARYVEVSREVFAIFGEITPLVQPLSIDEAFLDVTGSIRLLGSPRTIAETIRRRVRDRVGLTASVGIAPNKFLAKLASDLEKPDGLVELGALDVEGRIAALPIERLWGVGDASARRFHAHGLRTFGDLQRIGEREVEALLGRSGPGLRRLALGIDERPVRTDRVAKSIGSERTFGTDLGRADDVRGFVIGQAEEITSRLRRGGRLARTVTLKIRTGDFHTVTRSATLDGATDRTDRVMERALELLATWARSSFRPVRLIGTTVSNLAEPEDGRTVGLFEVADDGRRRRLDAATDAIRARFGGDAIGRGERASGSAERRQQREDRPFDGRPAD